MNGPTCVKCTPVLPFMWDILYTSFYAESRPVLKVGGYIYSPSHKPAILDPVDVAAEN